MTRRRLSAWALGAFLLAGFWLFLAPPALGGATSYVVTSGVSMEPLFHTGDLAAVRRQSSYAVGDIVAYRSPTLGEVILHRIHSGDAGGFRTKGDNNTWLDPDTIRPDQILGRLRVHVPRVGGYLHSSTSLTAAAVLGAVSVAVPARSRWRLRTGGSRRRAARVQGRSKRSAASALLAAATVLGVSGAGLLILGALATAPAPTPAPDVTHALQVTYRAAADATVYQGGTLVTGDPVYLKLNPSIDVQLRDEITGASTATARPLDLQARLVGASGWQYTVTLAGQTSGHGPTSDLRVHLDLRSLQSVIAQAAAHSGADGGSYQLQLLPTVRATGPAGSRTPPVTFKPVVFQAAGGQFVLVGADAERGAPVTRSASEPGAPTTAAAGTARRVQVGALSLPAPPLTVAGIGALVVAAALGAIGLRQFRRDPLARLSQPLVTVVARDVGAKTVMTESVDELFELARRYNRPVLEMVVAGRQTYAVEEGGIWYGCYLGRQPGGRPAPRDADTERIRMREGFPPVPPPRSPVGSSPHPV